MNKLPFEILVHIAEQCGNLRAFELVCKLWRDASRARTILISPCLATIEILVRYPSLLKYIGRLHLMKSDYLLTLKFTPPFSQGCIDPWVDLMIARPTIHCQFFMYLDKVNAFNQSTKVVTLINANRESIDVISAYSDGDYRFIDDLVVARSANVSMIIELYDQSFSKMPSTVHKLEVKMHCGNTSAKLVMEILNNTIVKSCRVLALNGYPADVFEVYKMVLIQEYPTITFTFV